MGRKRGAAISFLSCRCSSRHEPIEGCGTDPFVVEEYFGRHFGRKTMLTPDGRTAIAIIMRSLDLKPDDDIYITTTFGKPNVSSCVTSTIFNFCRPSRVMTERARAIFAIHEFGVPHPDIEKLADIAKERGIPLIEDCAHTIDSRIGGRMVGQWGAYALCSFPKLFPISRGGLLIGEGVRYEPTPVQRIVIGEVAALLPRYMRLSGDYVRSRIAHFRFLEGRFGEIGLKPLYTLADGMSPSLFFPLVTDRYEEVMAAASAANIECALWHGTNIVVLPIHQFLTKDDLECIVNAVKAACGA